MAYVNYIITARVLVWVEGLCCHGADSMYRIILCQFFFPYVDINLHSILAALTATIVNIRSAIVYLTRVHDLVFVPLRIHYCIAISYHMTSTYAKTDARRLRCLIFSEEPQHTRRAP